MTQPTETRLAVLENQQSNTDRTLERIERSLERLSQSVRQDIRHQTLWVIGSLGVLAAIGLIQIVRPSPSDAADYPHPVPALEVQGTTHLLWWLW